MRGMSDERVQQITQVARGVRAEQAVAGADPARAAPKHASDRTAIIEAMFLMAIVDGEVSKEEVRTFAAAVGRILGSVTAEQVEALLVEMTASLEREGWETRLRGVSQALRGGAGAESAFRLATAVAFVDDHVTHSESAALDALASGLEIAAERAHEIMSEVHRELFG